MTPLDISKYPNIFAINCFTYVMVQIAYLQSTRDLLYNQALKVVPLHFWYWKLSVKRIKLVQDNLDKLGLKAFAPSPINLIANATRSIQLLKSRFLPFEGDVISSNNIKIGMNVGSTSHLYHQDENHSLEGPWRRNGITVNLPNTSAICRSSAVTMIGLTIDPQKLDQLNGVVVDDKILMTLSGRISMDVYAARHMREIFSFGELHGCSSAFFEEKLAQLMRRLCGSAKCPQNAGPYRLDDLSMAKAKSFIDENLGEDVSVSEIARAIEMDVTNFTKAFRHAEGIPPYAYLTLQRMEKAKKLFRQGLNVTEVSLAVNYSNPSKFAAAFRRCTGYSPTFWRNCDAPLIVSSRI